MTLLLAVALAAPQEMESLLQRLSADDIDARETAATAILGRWREWREADLEALDERRGQDPELKGRVTDLLARIRTRRVVGEKLLGALPGVEAALLSGRSEDRVAVLESLRALWKKGGLPGAEALGLLRWIRSKDASPEVARAIESLESDGLKFDAALAIPLLKDPDARRRAGAIETLSHMQARDRAADLTPSLTDPDADVRRAAWRALARFRAREEAPRVLPLLTHPERSRRLAGLTLLARIGAAEAAEAVAPLVDDASPLVRIKAIEVLQDLGARRFAKEVSARVGDLDPLVRVAAIRCLGSFQEADSRPFVKALLAAKLPGVRASAHAALAAIGDRGDAAALAAALEDVDPEVRWTAAQGLAELGAESEAPKLAPLFADASPWVRAHAARAAGRLGWKGGREGLLPLLKDPEAGARSAALDALGALATEGDLPAIRAALKDDAGRVRAAAARALRRMGKGDDVRGLRTDADPQARAAAAPENAVEACRDPDPRVRRAALDRAAAVASPLELADLEALLEDPHSLIRAAAARALARRAADDEDAAASARLTTRLRAMVWDAELEVELSAGVGLLRLGRLDMAAQKALVDTVAGAESEVDASLALELCDALARRHEAGAHAKLRRAETAKAGRLGAEEVAAAIRGLGFKLEGRPRPAAGPASGWELLGAARGVYVEGDRVVLTDARSALALWRKRLD